MINLKVLLRLATAGVLTTVAATSVVACGDTKEAMDTKVSQNLGLTNDKGEGLIKGSIDVSKPADPLWKTSLVTEHLATKLVTGGTTGQVLGKDSDSTAFLKNVLKLKADSDDKFNYSDVAEITAVVDTINPTIGVNTAKTDYVITGGSFMLQFYDKDKKTKLGDNYAVNLAVDLGIGIVNDVIPNLTIADFDITGELATFKVGELVTNLIGKTGNLITKNPSNVNTQMVKVMKLLDRTAIFTVSVQSKNPTPNLYWASGDYLTLKITTSDVTNGFDRPVNLTL